MGHEHMKTFIENLCVKNILKNDKLVEGSGGKLVVGDASAASAATMKAHDTRGVAMTSAWRLALLFLAK